MGTQPRAGLGAASRVPLAPPAGRAGGRGVSQSRGAAEALAPGWWSPRGPLKKLLRPPGAPLPSREPLLGPSASSPPHTPNFKAPWLRPPRSPFAREGLGTAQKPSPHGHPRSRRSAPSCLPPVQPRSVGAAPPSASHGSAPQNREGNKRGSESTFPFPVARGSRQTLHIPRRNGLGGTMGTGIWTRPGKNGQQKYTNCSLLFAT